MGVVDFSPTGHFRVLFAVEEVGEDPKIPGSHGQTADGNDEAVDSPKHHIGKLGLEDLKNAADEDHKGGDDDRNDGEIGEEGMRELTLTLLERIFDFYRIGGLNNGKLLIS
jgi:hypothetical protein